MESMNKSNLAHSVSCLFSSWARRRVTLVTIRGVLLKGWFSLEHKLNGISTRKTNSSVFLVLMFILI